MDFDRYRDAELIAHGGFAIVYRAVDSTTGQVVAIKLLNKLGPKEEARFEREYQSLLFLSQNTNVVRVLDSGRVENGAPYLVLDYLHGGSLKDAMGDGNIEPTDAVWIASRVLEALSVAHEHGILHRDIKPSNILLGRGDAVLADFGIARLADGSETTTASLTATIQYAAPETFTGGGTSIQSDLFSVGATIYALITGRAVYADLSDALAFATQPEPPDMTGVPEPLAQWLTTMLAAFRQHRPRSADEALASLATVQLGGSDSPAQPSPRLQCRLDAKPPTVSITEATTAYHLPEQLNGGTGAATARFDPSLLPSTLDHDQHLHADHSHPDHNRPAHDRPDRHGAQRSTLTALLVALALVVGAGAATLFLSLTNGDNDADDADAISANEDAEGPTADGNGSTPGGATDGDEDTENEPEQPEVPRVVGQTKQQATTTLTGLGFEVNVEEEPSETFELGQVISQSSPPGSQETQGETITLTVSSGRPDPIAPNLVGLSRAEALETLVGERLQSTIIETRVPAGSDQIGNVISQIPVAGATVPGDSKVQIEIGKAPPPCETRTDNLRPRDLTVVPTLISGDDDFDANGPAITLNLRLEISDMAITAIATMTADETAPDEDGNLARAAGTETVQVYTPPEGWRVDSIDIAQTESISYVDASHDDDDFDLGQGPATQVEFIGDTKGSEVGTKTRAKIRFRPFTITLKALGDCS